jgi:hypothetical protein
VKAPKGSESLGFPSLVDNPCFVSVVVTDQWWSVPFKIREDDLIFYEYGLIYITAYQVTAIHIPFTQLNVTLIGLGYYIILELSLYPS